MPVTCSCRAVKRIGPDASAVTIRTVAGAGEDLADESDGLQAIERRARMSNDTAPTQPADEPDVRHDTFTISRRLDAPPPEVFAAFADPMVRRRWFRLPGSGST
jgi:hypothetical protein